MEFEFSPDVLFSIFRLDKWKGFEHETGWNIWDTKVLYFYTIVWRKYYSYNDRDFIALIEEDLKYIKFIVQK